MEYPGIQNIKDQYYFYVKMQQNKIIEKNLDKLFKDIDDKYFLKEIDYLALFNNFFYNDLQWLAFIREVKQSEKYNSLNTYQKRIFGAFYIHIKKFFEGKIINMATYRKIIGMFNEAMLDKVLSGEEVRLFSDMGKVRINKKRMDYDRLQIDFNQSKEKGYTVYHFNDHSNGFYYRTHWRKGFFKHVNFYSFSLTQENKKKLAKKIKSGQDFTDSKTKPSYR